MYMNIYIFFYDISLTWSQEKAYNCNDQICSDIFCYKNLFFISFLHLESASKSKEIDNGTAAALSG